VIDDGDMKISKQENKDGVPFEVLGEPFTDYYIELTDCKIENPGTSPPLSGQIPVGGIVTGFELETDGVYSGFIYVTVTLTDAAGNESTASDSLEVATVAPNPPVFDTSAHSTQDPNIYWNWHSGGGGNGYYRWKINDPDLTSEPEWNISEYNYAAPADGAYTLYVEERNDLNNWSDTASQTITLDRGDPVVTAPASISVVAEGDHGTPKTSTAIADFLSGATVTDAIDPSPVLDVTVGGGTPPATFPVGVTTVTFTGTDNVGNTHVVNRTVSVENTVFTPDGGESWEAGTTHEVTWAHNDADNVDIDLYKGGSLDSEITASTADTGSYSWTIPSGQATGTDYTVRVTDLETNAFDESDASFTIENITVSSPNGGEVWAADTQHDVTWTSSGSGNVKIELYKGAILDSEITASTADNGSYSWTIPSGQTAGTDYRIRVTDLATSVYDESGADFEITNP
jgi:hypothetical protein